MSIESLVQTTDQASTDNGLAKNVQAGMGLYQQVQQVQQQNQQLQAQQDQLDQARFNTATSNMATLARANPVIAKRMVPKIYDNLSKAGIPVDKGVLDTLASDDAYKQRFSAISAALQGQANDPATRQAALSAFGDIGEFDRGLSLFEQQNKTAASASTAAAKAGATVDAAKASAQGRVDAAQIAADAKKATAGASTGLRLDAAEGRAAKNITTDANVVSLTKSVQQAQKDYDLIQEAKSHGLTPLKAHELVQSYVGLLKGQAAGSVGAERESLEKSALDLETKGNTWLQSINPNGIVHYDDQPFLKEMESSVRGIHGTLTNSLDKRTDALTRQSSYGSINDAQASAKQKIMSATQLGSGEQATPAPAPTSPPKLNDSQLQAYVKAAKSAGYTEAQAIAHYNQVHGIK